MIKQYVSEKRYEPRNGMTIIQKKGIELEGKLELEVYYSINPMYVVFHGHIIRTTTINLMRIGKLAPCPELHKKYHTRQTIS